jgi:hypothetical protein
MRRSFTKSLLEEPAMKIRMLKRKPEHRADGKSRVRELGRIYEVGKGALDQVTPEQAQIWLRDNVAEKVSAPAEKPASRGKRSGGKVVAANAAETESPGIGAGESGHSKGDEE